MATNQLKIVISLLKEFPDGNIPTESDYGVTREQYYDIIDAMQDETLVKGIIFSRGGKGNKILFASLDATKITIKGMEYLNDNSALVKTYKGLKEIREWLPF